MNAGIDPPIFRIRLRNGHKYPANHISLEIGGPGGAEGRYVLTFESVGHRTLVLVEDVASVDIVNLSMLEAGLITPSRN